MSLWTKCKILKKFSPHICTQTKTIMNQRASFCTRRKASLTVEGSFTIPLAIFFLTIILFFFRVIQVQSKVEEALMYAARLIAVESSIVSSEILLLASAEAALVTMIEDSVVEQYVENGVWGVSILQSDVTGENIVLHADYKMSLPVSFFGIDSIDLSNECCCRKWLGDNPLGGKEEWVYITPNGSVYHLDINCRALDIKPKAAPYYEIVNYRGKNGQKFYCCGRCEKEGITTVYYTDYGRLYHANMTCSALKRTIQRISVTEIGGRRACAFCRE